MTPAVTPHADDGRYELLFEGHAKVSLYAYNDILLRKDTPGLTLDASDVNGRYPTYLSVDGYTPLGDDGPDAPPPRVVIYGASPHYHLLKLTKSTPTAPSAAHSGATAFTELDTPSASAFRLPEGEALRKVQILRERPRGAQDLGAAPGLGGCYYDA